MAYTIDSIKNLDNLISHFNKVNGNSIKLFNFTISGLEHIEEHFPEIVDQFEAQYGEPMKNAIKNLQKSRDDLQIINKNCENVVNQVYRFNDKRPGKTVDKVTDKDLPRLNPNTFEELYGNNGSASLNILFNCIYNGQKAIISELYNTRKFWTGGDRTYNQDIENAYRSSLIKVLSALSKIKGNVSSSNNQKVADSVFKCTTSLIVELKAHANEHKDNSFIQQMLQPLYNIEKSITDIIKQSKYNNSNLRQNYIQSVYQQAEVSNDSLKTCLLIIKNNLIPDTIQQLQDAVTNLQKTDPNSTDLKLFTACLEDFTQLQENIARIAVELDKTNDQIKKESPIA